MMREKRRGISWALGLIAVAMALAGCASSGTSAISAIDLKSPGLQLNGELKPNVRCGWGSIWVPLEWGSVPEDTKELAVYIGRFEYLNKGKERKLVVPFGELVSHIKPSVRRVPANVLPDGASWSNSNPLSCPPQVHGQHVLLGLFALDRIQQPREMTKGLATRLTEEFLKQPNRAQRPTAAGTLSRDTLAAGWLTTMYPGVH